MRNPSGMRRHVDRLLSDLAAEHGRVEVVRRRHGCDPDERDRLVDVFDAFGVVGGAGAWLTDDDGRVLLVRHADDAGVDRDAGTDGDGGAVEGPSVAWTDPGAGVEPGEDYRDCARRAVRDRAGLDPALDGVARVHVRYFDDWTDRRPVPQPVVLFAGTAGGDPEPGEGVADAAWFETLPDDLLYDDLAELPVPEPA